ncbi:shikimate dehydrogenase [Lactobacillaceae bacterium L1_55_11]|nr:shikimate dehydrogenase [Lactobacillaceae bacterium L1_55_11]
MLYGLLAHPAGHSRSPQMQNAMMAAAGMTTNNYQAFDVNPEQLETAVLGLRALGVGGFNVSTPFKAAIIPLLDELSPLSQRLGAVNTVKREGDRLVGTSTDGPGFWHSLPAKQARQRVVLFGTGGAARAVIASAPEFGVEELTVFNRRHDDWHQRVEQIEALNPTAELVDLADTPRFYEALDYADLVVNATSVGMDNQAATLLTPEDVGRLPKSAMVADMVYRQPTRLLALAKAQGLATQNGLPMLVGQGALSFEYWFNQPADVELMKKEIEE